MAEHATTPPHWPFATEAEFAERQKMLAEGYALLAEAHRRWMAAYDARKRAKEKT